MFVIILLLQATKADESKFCNSTAIYSMAECPIAYTNLCCNMVLLTNQSYPQTNFKSCLNYGDFGCKAGFYTVGNLTKPCPAGFYCSEGSRCVIPCASGGYCPGYTMVNNTSSCIRDGETAEAAIVSGVYVCPGEFKESSCSEQFYCPDTIHKIKCPDGKVCNKGSTRPYRCNLFKGCGYFTDPAVEDVIGIVLLFLMVVLLVIQYCYQKRYSHRSKLYHHKVRTVGLGNTTMRLSYNLSNALWKSVEVDIQGYRELLPKNPTKITIRVEGLSFTIDKGMRILKDMDIEFKHSRLNVIMGPSGCGKSTLLNIMMGYRLKGKSSGNIYMNDTRVNSLSQYRQHIGYVTQDDVMHENLTVREILTYQAQLRLSRDYDNAYISESVNEIINLLGLNKVRDNIVGGSEKNGISGGQRRRVSIGMELVANPNVLILDEPTSGLDSATSLSVITLLSKLSTQVGINVICVIHQPRIEVFSLFHNITLISQKGKIAYNSDADQIKLYFEKLGYMFNCNSNPADVIIDIVSGLVVSCTCFSDNLNEIWKESMTVGKNEKNEESSEISMIDTDILKQQQQPQRPQQEQQPTLFSTCERRNWISQCSIMLHRQIILSTRSFTRLLKECIMALLMGLLLGVLFRGGDYGLINASVNLTVLAVGLLIVTNSLKVFGEERLVFVRESQSGVNVVSYFLANNIENMPWIFIYMPISYLSVYWTGADVKGSFAFYYALLTLTTFSTSGIGYFISILVQPRSANLFSVGAVLIFSMFSGCTLTICELDNISILGPIFYTISFGKWFVQAALLSEYQNYSNIYGYRYVYNMRKNKYVNGDEWTGFWVLFGLGIVFRILTLILLIWKKSNINIREIISKCCKPKNNIKGSEESEVSNVTPEISDVSFKVVIVNQQTVS